MGQKIAAAVLAVQLLQTICLCSAVETHRAVQEFNGTLTSEEIFYNTEDGRTLSVVIEPGDIVEDLKERIRDIEGTPANRMRLRLGADWLIRGSELKSRVYNMTSGQVVTVIFNEDEGYDDTKFFVQNLNGDRREVNMPLGQPAARLMDIVARWTGIPNWQQRILCNGKQLQPERRLLSYPILYSLGNPMKIKRPPNPMSTLRLGKPLESCRTGAKILVRTLSGATITIESDLAETATDLKRKIEAIAGVPLIVQHLLFNQQVVAGEDHLCDYGLEEGSRVYLVLSSSVVDSPEKVAILAIKPVDPSGQTPDSSSQPYKAPIFHEADDAEEPKLNQPEVSIYGDVRNWVFERRQRPEVVAALFDSVA